VLVGENRGMCPTYSFQISVDDFVPVQIAEPASDPGELRNREWRIRSSQVRPTSSKRLAPGYFVIYPCMFPFAIH